MEPTQVNQCPLTNYSLVGFLYSPIKSHYK